MRRGMPMTLSCLLLAAGCSGKQASKGGDEGDPRQLGEPCDAADDPCDSGLVCHDAGGVAPAPPASPA